MNPAVHLNTGSPGAVKKSGNHKRPIDLLIPNDGMSEVSDFEALVQRFYAPLYRFAFSLTRSEPDACDLTQQTFLRFAKKGHQLRDRNKAKSWLFTTLHREFLAQKRKAGRQVQETLEHSESELPVLVPDLVSRLDSKTVVLALEQVDQVFQAPIALYYLEDYSYQNIADILEIPLGTVKSRISRGIAQLQFHIQSLEPAAVRPGQPQT